MINTGSEKRSYYFSLASSSLIPFIIFLSVGCAPHSSFTSQNSGGNSGTSAPAASSSAGGSDGSGGFTGVSTPEQVQEAVRSAKLKVALGFSRMKIELKSKNLPSHDKRWTAERRTYLAAMIQGTPRLGSPVTDLLASNRITWDYRAAGPCNANDGRHADGAAKLPTTICISIQRLTRFPLKSLEAFAVQLIAHELAHLYIGESEGPPVAIDSLFAESEDIWAANPKRIQEVATDLNQLYQDTLDQLKWLAAEKTSTVQKPVRAEPCRADVSAYPGSPENLRRYEDEVVKTAHEDVYYPHDFSIDIENLNAIIDEIIKAEKPGGADDTCEDGLDRRFITDRFEKLRVQFSQALESWNASYGLPAAK